MGLTRGDLFDPAAHYELSATWRLPLLATYAFKHSKLSVPFECPQARKKKSLTAIICRFKHEAQAVYEALKGLPGVRLQTGDLSFEPGLLITNVHQVKGLEFSGVILWNPTQKAYPATELGKNLLYVAITRASDRLALYHHEPLSCLLAE